MQAYRQATSLEPGRLFSWVQSGSIQLSLGATADALADFDRALDINALYLPALLGAAQALLASAQRHISYGALGKPFDRCFSWEVGESLADVDEPPDRCAENVGQHLVKHYYKSIQDPAKSRRRHGAGAVLYSRPGLVGLAAKELASAERRAVEACAQGSKLRSAWKLLGDIRIAHHGVTPHMSAPARQNGLPSASDAVAQ